MVEDQQVRKLRKYLGCGMSLLGAALKSGMTEKTARKYRDSGTLPSELSTRREWRTQSDPFEGVWADLHEWLNVNPELTAVDALLRIQHNYPGRFSKHHLRTLQRGFRKWRASRQPDVLSSESAARTWMHDILQSANHVNRVRDDLGALSVVLLKTVAQSGRMTERKKALAVLASKKGIPNGVIARFLNLSPKTTRRYYDLIREQGTDGLFSRKRSGVLKSEDTRFTDPVIATLHAPPSTYGINRTTWKQDDLRRVLADRGISISKQNIRATLKKAGYRWRKAKRVLTSTDPEYREKLAAITTILSTISPTERFFSIDEFGPFYITKKPGRKLIAPGEIYSIPQHQKSRGRLIVTAALELCTNQVTHFYSDRKNTAEMIRLVDILLEQYAGAKKLYLSWDAASWHMSKRFYEMVADVNVRRQLYPVCPRIELAPLPAGAQFLNVIESVFSGMARAIIHNSDYQSTSEAKTAIDRHFEERNASFRENPKRAGNKIWGKERTPPVFSGSNNCKDPTWR